MKTIENVIEDNIRSLFAKKYEPIMIWAFVIISEWLAVVLEVLIPSAKNALWMLF